jgi:hypothetical protein
MPPLIRVPKKTVHIAEGDGITPNNVTLLPSKVPNGTVQAVIKGDGITPNDVTLPPKSDLSPDNTNTSTGNSDKTNTSTPTAAPTLKPLPTAPTYDSTKWGDTEAGKQAWQAYQDALAKYNGYGDFTYGNKEQLDAIINSILNREKFSYDLNGDALYQQYKDKYIQQGKMAMGDAMGQAAAMTGGYGNSYAQSVGQQMYQKELQNLNDIVPELYQMALDRYNAEGQELYNQYGMLTDDYDRGYSQYMDKYNQLMDMLGIARGDYYDGANMFHTEQSNKNSISSQIFNDAMNIWNAENNNAWNNAEWQEGIRRYEDNKESGKVETESIVNDFTNEENEETQTHLDRMNLLGSYDAATDYVNKLPNLTDEEKIDLLSQYEVVPGLADRTWVVDEENGKGYGGGNLLGINRDAQIKDAYGNSMTLAEFREKLMREENMTLAEANAYIKEMQDELGIKSGLQGFFDKLLIR